MLFLLNAATPNRDRIMSTPVLKGKVKEKLYYSCNIAKLIKKYIYIYVYIHVAPFNYNNIMFTLYSKWCRVRLQFIDKTFICTSVNYLHRMFPIHFVAYNIVINYNAIYTCTDYDKYSILCII